MAITTNVPSNNFEDLQRDVQDATRFTNATAPFTNRVGLSITPIPMRDSQLAAKVAEAASAVEALGWFPVAGSFTDGGTITARNQVLFNGADSSFYSWSGALPKVVPAASTPASAGGISANAWVSRGDAALRSALAAPDSTVPVGGVEAGDLAGALKSSLIVINYGLIGDGVTINNAALTALQSLANGRAITFTNGTYRFSGDITFTVPVIMSGGVLLGDGFVNFNAGVTVGNYRWLRMRLGRFNGSVNPVWYGARANGLSETPLSTGDDVESEPWNTWDGTLFKTNADYSPYFLGEVFTPPRATPFKNTDTWDYIGLSLSLWNSKSVEIHGTYNINLSSSDRGEYNGLIIMRGMECSLTGRLPDSIVTTVEDAAYFSANNVGVFGHYKLLTQYRNGGPPTNIKGIWFRGPTGYSQTAKNLTLEFLRNTNGSTTEGCWLSAASRAMSGDTSVTDCFIKNCTTEYCFDDQVYTTADSEIRVSSCNMWASASVVGQNGIRALGKCQVSDSKLLGFRGDSINAADLEATGVTVRPNSLASSAINVTSKAVISGGSTTGGTNGAMLNLPANCQVVGHNIEQSANHPCINLGAGSAGSAIDIVISGCRLTKTNAAAEQQNYAITATQSGVNFTGAATASCLITGNIFRGRSLQVIGSASIKNNVFDGVYVP